MTEDEKNAVEANDSEEFIGYTLTYTDQAGIDRTPDVLIPPDDLEEVLSSDLIRAGFKILFAVAPQREVRVAKVYATPRVLREGDF